MQTSDIITVVRDPKHVLGKIFSINSDGSVRKDTAVSVSVGEAIQHYVPDNEALKKLLADVSEDPHAAIINSAFPLIPIGTPFLILSEKELAKKKIERIDTSVTWPVNVRYQGKDWPALGRFKEHTAPSTWLLLDRDIDDSTPERYATLNYDDWLDEVDKLLPGVLQCARLRAHSSSARVSYQGKPVGGGNGHTWIQVDDASDINRLRTIVKARALVLGMSWEKPRHAKKTGEVVGSGTVTIVDYSVFMTGRLVFVGKPEVQDAI